MSDEGRGGHPFGLTPEVAAVHRRGRGRAGLILLALLALYALGLIGYCWATGGPLPGARP